MDSGLLSLIPLNSKSLCENLIADECVNINVVEPRKSKYGDFRFKVNNTPSINTVSYTHLTLPTTLYV